MTTPTIHYEPVGATLRAFMRSSAFVRGLIGPFGSGKTTCVIIELFRRACSQEPDATGIRKTRWAAIRSTFPELRTTTLPSWAQWFNRPEFGDISWTPPFEHKLRFALSARDRARGAAGAIAADGQPYRIREELLLSASGDPAPSAIDRRGSPQGADTPPLPPEMPSHVEEAIIQLVKALARAAAKDDHQASLAKRNEG